MGFRRGERDMFGRPASSPAPAPAPEPPAPPLRRRHGPPGLVPFVPVIALVFVLALILLVPVVGVAALIVLGGGGLVAIMRARYVQVKDLGSEELGGDPTWRYFEDLRRGRLRASGRDRRPD